MRAALTDSLCVKDVLLCCGKDRNKLLYTCQPWVQVHIACAIYNEQKEMSNNTCRRGTRLCVVHLNAETTYLITKTVQSSQNWRPYVNYSLVDSRTDKFLPTLYIFLKSFDEIPLRNYFQYILKLQVIPRSCTILRISWSMNILVHLVDYVIRFLLLDVLGYTV
jgi:hypothetical protein